MPITIESTATGLNQVQRTYGMNIWQEARVGLEWETLVPVRATDRTHVEANATVEEILQPYQWQYTAKGGVNFDSVENTLKAIKADVKITADDLEKFWDSWKVEWFDVGRDPLVYSFPRWLYETQYVDKVIEEQNQMAWSGVFAAPTAGTAGTSISSVDGFKKKIGDAVTAGDLTEIATGALLEGSMVDQVETFCDTIPQPYRDLPGQLIMSTTNARKYARNYRSNFGTGNSVSGNENNELRIDYTRKTIRGMMSMDTTTSDRIIFVPNRYPGLIYGVRRGFPQQLAMRWEKEERIVKGLGEFYRFYGATYWEFVFVNDQE